MEGGWIRLYRKISENPYYFSEKFCRIMAWVDLLLLANHSNGIFYKRGIRVEVNRGQLGYDIDTLAKRWKWSRGKVERWLSELEKSNQIVRQKGNVTTIITIINYEEYQGGDKTNGNPNSNPDDKANRKANGHEQERKEFKERKKRKKIDIDSFVLENLKSVWSDWICYRAQIHKPYKTDKGVKAAYENLIALCDNVPSVAEQIVKQSIRNEWQGLFPLKSESTTKPVNGKPKTRLQQIYEASHADDKF